MIGKRHFVFIGLLAALAFATAGRAAEIRSDRLVDIDKALAAKGYQGGLASKEHIASKALGDGTVAAVSLWLKAPQGKRLRDARQIKFAESRCANPGMSSTKPSPLAKPERDAFFSEVIGLSPPAELDADLQALAYGDTKVYAFPPFKKLRIKHLSMKCDGRGGDAYELDLFP